MIWDKMFANHVSGKRLIFKTYRELIQINSKKLGNQLKMIKEPEEAFSYKWCTNGQQIHEKVLNMANHQGNANQTRSEISPHTC